MVFVNFQLFYVPSVYLEPIENTSKFGTLYHKIGSPFFPQKTRQRRKMGRKNDFDHKIERSKMPFRAVHLAPLIGSTPFLMSERDPAVAERGKK